MTEVVCFYWFEKQSPELAAERAEILRQRGTELELRGLVLVGQEGFNQTVCGARSAIEAYKRIFTEEWGISGIHFKHSQTSKSAFPRFKVKLKDEIVAIGKPGMIPQGPHNRHLEPKDFYNAMNEPGVVLIDTRNSYETQIGKFKNAVDPNIRTFQEFPEFVRRSSIAATQKILIYCTGGIRCEKAILEMSEQGYQNVYQLKGGILNYFEEMGDTAWEGECFLFDHRVSVTPDLKPSEIYGLCPHCGNPGDVDIHCDRCQKPGRICKDCSKTGKRKCSKDCSKRTSAHLKFS